MDVSLESKSLPSVGYSRKSYLQTTSQRLVRDKLVHLNGWRSLALPSVGPGGLQGEFGDLDIKYLKQNISKYLKMSVVHIGKRQENTAALCRKISQNVGRTYREASGEHCGTVQNGCETLRAPDVKYPGGMSAKKISGCETSGWNVGGAEFRMCCLDHLLSLATSFRQPATTHVPSPSDGVSGRPVRTSFVGIPKNFPQSLIVLVVEETQTILVLELLEDDNSLFESIVSPVEEVSNLYSLVSCNSISISAPHSPTPQIFDIDDEIAQPDLDIDSFDHDSDPIDERVSPAIGDVETVDFGTEDQPRELKIGSPLSIYESDRLVHLLMSYLDVFAWPFDVVFMDGFSGIMPFGLKNARATYQRATTTLFHDMMHRVVEVYVDDMIVKSEAEQITY
ncbi:hypothetical protein CK203_064257 [Vitis vinifera]|uniref:Reverse transcriptase domain-containing protein n=1 Tax=Vitis vinifera TaxID=29760 RepID=A0A438G3U6_VITVI|nr:hypothetical protein CK203_064257 [Vitis vinifera]